MRKVPRPAGDTKLVQIVDAALADVTAKSGDWLACRPGCAQCCHGAFRINQLDVARLQQGMSELARSDKPRAVRVEERAKDWINRNRRGYPGSINTGVLRKGNAADAAFEGFANDEPCPALDPTTLTCDLYTYRPMTCRVFGPPIRTDDGLGVCELCFQGAPNPEIARCELVPDPDDIESKLLRTVDAYKHESVVAFALFTGRRRGRLGPRK
jgi:Fe-S-cluster containining protein